MKAEPRGISRPHFPQGLGGAGRFPVFPGIIPPQRPLAIRSAWFMALQLVPKDYFMDSDRVGLAVALPADSSLGTAFPLRVVDLTDPLAFDAGILHFDTDDEIGQFLCSLLDGAVPGGVLREDAVAVRRMAALGVSAVAGLQAQVPHDLSRPGFDRRARFGRIASHEGHVRSPSYLETGRTSGGFSQRTVLQPEQIRTLKPPIKLAYSFRPLCLQRASQVDGLMSLRYTPRFILSPCHRSDKQAEGHSKNRISVAQSRSDVIAVTISVDKIRWA